MGIFNQHSFGQPWVRGIQGAPGVGFNLTADGNYDMVGKKLTNVGTPTSNADAATKKYVDDNSGGGTYSNLRIDSNIDMKDTYCILNLKSPSDGDQPATKQYADINFFFRNGSHPMTGDVNMNNHKIKNLPTPNAGDQPATKSYTDNNFLKLRRQTEMTGNLNLGAHRIIHLSDPQGTNDAATKIYTDNLVDTTVSNYLKRDGTNAMTGDLNTGGHKIINL